MPAPLAHLRVVDVTDVRGALAGRLLADLGADVVKVEPPAGDRERLRPPFAGGVSAPDRGLAFLYRNANKRGAVIDLHSADGWHRFCELCERADVLVENWGPTASDDTASAPPRSASATRISSTWRWRTSASPATRTLAARAAARLRRVGGAPRLGVPGSAAVLASGLRRARLRVDVRGRRRARGRDRSRATRPGPDGRGLRAGGGAERAQPVVDPARRLRAALPDAARHAAPERRRRVLRAADRGWLGARAARLAAAVEGLRGAAREPEALEGPQWEIALFRLTNADVVRMLSEEALRPRPRADVLAEARRLDVPMTPVNTPEEFVAEEQTRRRGYFRRTGFPHLGDAPFAPAPFNFSRTPAVLDRPAPAPGADDGGRFPVRRPEQPGTAEPRLALAGVRVIDLGVGVAVPRLAGSSPSSAPT